MLTRKQHELLSFIDSHLKETGVSPSFEEMKEALSLRSKSGIHRLISALEERGFLRRHHHRARALEVVKLPENMAHQALPTRREGAKPAPAAPGFSPNVIRGDFSARLPGVRAAQDAAAISMPLYGRIAAGQAIEALRDDGAHIEVPMAMLGAGDHFALEVAGDSMIDAGILDGDTVVIRKGEMAETGQIIVALIDDNEVTLKRIRKRGNSIALEPANAKYEPRLLPADRVRVQGRLVALLRSLLAWAPMSTDTHFYEPALGHGLAHDPFNAIIGPRPIGWISSRGRDGSVNLAPYSFFNAFNYHPPIIGFASVGAKDTLRNVQETGVFAWNLATRALAEPMNASCAPVPYGQDEFGLAGLTQLPCRLIDVPRVAESLVHFECRVSDIVQLKGWQGAPAQSWLVLGEVVGVHIARSTLVDGVFDTFGVGIIQRGGGPTAYAEIRPEDRFDMRRPG